MLIRRFAVRCSGCLPSTIAVTMSGAIHESATNLVSRALQRWGRRGKAPRPLGIQFAGRHVCEPLEGNVGVSSHQPAATRYMRSSPAAFSLIISWPFFFRPVSAARVVCGSQPVAETICDGGALGPLEHL